MAAPIIPTPRAPALIEADFHRRCTIRADAITRCQFDIAWWASRRIDDLLDEYLRARART